jgi:TonB family protein
MCIVAALCAVIPAAAAAQEVEPPRVEQAAPVVYPADGGGSAREVHVIVTVDRDGRVTAAELKDPPDDRIGEAALAAARAYRFVPAKVGGKPMASRVTLRIRVAPPPASAPAPAPAHAPAPARAPAPAPPPVVIQTVEITGERPTDSITRFTLDRHELETIPGTGGDALRTVESLPGVARAPAFSGLIIMRGSAPEDTQVFVDGAAVPIAFHFGGLSSILPTDVLDHLDVYPGNYDVSYGRGLGGVIDLGLRSPAKDRLHALAKADLLDGRALVEAPIDEHTRFLVAARRSWIDAWFPSVARDLQVGVTASPVYYDYQAVLERDLGPRATLRGAFFGSSDSVAVTLPPSASDPAFNGLLTNSSTFWRGQLRLDGKLENGTRYGALASVGHDTLSLGLTDYLADEDVWRVSGRADVDVKLSRAVRARAGVDVEAGWYSFDLVFPAIPTPDEPDAGPIFGRPPLHQSRTDTYFDPAVFARLEIDPLPRVRAQVGVRVDAFSAVPGVAVEPRGSLRWTVVDWPRKTVLKTALGVYAQEPQPFENDSVFGTPGIAFERALQASGGIEQEIAPNVDVSLEGFYKDLTDLVSRRPDANAPSGFRYGNEGTGFVYGTELLLKYRPDPRFYGWIAYTVSRSERRSLPEEDLRLFEYDETHVLSALFSVRLGGGWETGARVRYTSGFPYTPVVAGAFDADAGGYAPIEQRPLFTGRVPAFFSLDLRVQKTWQIGEHSSVSAYVDALNTTNRKNIEGITSNFDFSRTGVVAGIPFLPVVGVRGEL